jgi:hypothetical protein
MKRVIFTLIISFMALHFSFGQCAGCVVMYDIQTPNGSIVETFLCSESHSSAREVLDNYYKLKFSEAIQIPTYDGYSSTSKFNCHGYAWLRVDRGIYRWISPGFYSNLGAFVTDGSYVEVSSETFPGKISWTNDDHSGITTAEPGWVISKWDNGPLCRHRWNDSPYGTPDSPPTLKYYVRNCGNTGIPIIVLENQTIITNQPFAACNITGKNVTVTNGVKLILDADEETNIISNFEVQLGSELEIK